MSAPGTPVRIGAVDVLLEGAGPDTIVMLHGWPDSLRLWDRQVAALAPHYRCARFTLPGFEAGAPSKTHSLDDIVEVIGQVVAHAGAGGPVTLLLHDWGCFFGYQFAQRHPQAVRRIIGVDVGDAGSQRNLDELDLRAKAQVLGYQLWLASAWRLGGALGDAMARRMARAARAPADPAAITAAMGYPYYVQWIKRGYAQARRFDPHCPMLFLYGRRKPFMFHSSAWAEAVGRRPGGRVQAFDSGHWLMAAQPDAFNASVLDWLRATDEAR